MEEQLKQQLQDVFVKEKAEQVDQILTEYKQRVNLMRDFYIEQLDDYVYSKDLNYKCIIGVPIVAQ